MHDEYQASQPRSVEIGVSYPYLESPDRQRTRVLTYTGSAPDSLRYRVFKRILDIVFVMLSLPVLLPLLAIIAAVVKLSSPGPAKRRILLDVEVPDHVCQLSRGA
jgi:hypothetical protein